MSANKTTRSGTGGKGNFTILLKINLCLKLEIIFQYYLNNFCILNSVYFVLK